MKVACTVWVGGKSKDYLSTLDLGVYEENENGSWKLVEGPWTVSLIPRYPDDQNRIVRNPNDGSYIYIEDVINDRSNLIRCYSTIKNSQTGEINSLFKSVETLMTGDDAENRRLQVMLMLSSYSPVGTKNINIDKNGARLTYGDDGTGQYNTSGYIDPTNELYAKVAQAFDGTLTTPNGIDQLREELLPIYQPDYIISAGFPSFVERSAEELAMARGDCMNMSDTGGYSPNYETDLKKRAGEQKDAEGNTIGTPWNSWNSMLYVQYCKVFDSYTGRYFWVTPVYFAIQRHLYCDATYFIAEPVANIEKGAIDSSISLAYVANHTERGDLGDVELNGIISEPEGKYFLTQYTTWKQYSILKRAHAAKFICYLKKTIPSLLKDLLQHKGTAYWIAQANTRLNTFLSRFLAGTDERYSILSSFSCNVTFDSSSNEMDVYISVTPIRAIERIIVNISVA